MSVITNAIARILNVRNMSAADLPRLLQIEQHRAGPRWIRHDLLVNPPSTSRGIWVAAIQNHVVGYLVYQVLPDFDETARLAVGSPHAIFTPDKTTLPLAARLAILHVYVAPDWRRRGIGKALVEKFNPQVPKKECRWVQAAVPETNLSMQLLLRAAGFKAVKVLRGYYAEEDAYLMECRRGE